jgi:predicted MPP superfamily phosphohydrolase
MSRTLKEVTDKMSDHLDQIISYDAVCSKFGRERRAGRLPSAEKLLGSDLGTQKDYEEKKYDKETGLEIANAIQRGCNTIEKLAKKLDCTYKEAKLFVDEAILSGHTIAILDGFLSFEFMPKLSKAKVVQENGYTRFAMISDTHIGSKHCYEIELNRFIHDCYDRGYRTITMNGDNIDSSLNHHGFIQELKYIGFDAQIDRMMEILPQLPGLKYYFIVGNHETNSFWKTSGFRPDEAMEHRLHKKGRTDFMACGSMSKGSTKVPAIESAYLLLNSGNPETEIKVELSHTSDRTAYAKSYAPQKAVDATLPEDRPDLLLKGHLHSLSQFEYGDVMIIQTMCWKGPGTWERQKRMSPAIGGIMFDIKQEGNMLDIKTHVRKHKAESKIWVPIK